MLKSIFGCLVAISVFFAAALSTPADDELQLTAEQQRILNEAQKNNAEMAKLYGQKKYAEAAKLAEQVLQACEEVFGKDHLHVATNSDNLAKMYRAIGKVAEAEPHCLRAIAIYEKKLGPEHLDLAIALDNLAEIYRAQRKLAQAEPIRQRIVKIYEKIRGPEHHDVALGLNSLGQLYFEQGKFADAEPVQERALKIQESILGPDHASLTTYINNLAFVSHRLGKHQQAEQLFQRNLKIYESSFGADHPAVATSLYLLASTYKNQSKYSQAEPLYERILKIREKSLGPEHPEVAQSLDNLATIFDLQGKSDLAVPLYERAAKIQETKLGSDHHQLAVTLNNLAVLYQAQGNFGKAEPLFQRALQIDTKSLGPNDPRVATNLNNLAELYRAQGKKADAESLYLQAIKIGELTPNPKDYNLAECLNNLAELYREQAKFAQAEPLYQRALAIYEATFGPSHPNLAAIRNNMALFYNAQGKYDQAEPIYLQSLNILEDTLGPLHPDLAKSLINLSTMYAAQEDWRKATTTADRARRIVRGRVDRVLPSLSPKEQLVFTRVTDSGPLHSALSLGALRRDDPQIAELSAGWLANSKGVGHEALTQILRLARASGDPKADAAANELLNVRRQLAALVYVNAHPTRDSERRRQIEQLQNQEETLSRRMAQETGREYRADPWIDGAEVRKSIPADAVFIDIAHFQVFNFRSTGAERKFQPASYAAWIIPPAGKGDVSIVDLGEAEKIDAAVRTARQAIQSAGRLPRDRGLGGTVKSEPGALRPTPAQLEAEALKSLAKLIFDPLVAKMGDAKRLILSPDASLWLVPWGALPMADGKYAIEKYEMRYVISGRDLVARSATKQQATAPVLFANPDFDLQPTKAAAATRSVLRRAPRADELATREVSDSREGLFQVQRLPGTAEEAAAIQPKLKQYAQAEPLTYVDQFALEGVFKTVQRPRVLVLSTHGFFLADQEVKHDERSGQLAATEQSQRAGTPALTVDGKPVENPLLRCGLLLAGCNQNAAASRPGAPGSRPEEATLDDGILTGMEIVGTDLRGTELVVLSACETGLGEVRNGEGVAGLRQAFQLAGAKAVVSTLWQIPDKDSALLVSQFFTNLAASQSKAEALRNAQLSQIELFRQRNATAHPFFWAAFTITGE